MEHRRLAGGVIDAIEHEAVKMNIEIGGGAEALDEGDGTGLRLCAFQTGLFDQKGRNGAVDDL